MKQKNTHKIHTDKHKSTRTWLSTPGRRVVFELVLGVQWIVPVYQLLKVALFHGLMS